MRQVLSAAPVAASRFESKRPPPGLLAATAGNQIANQMYQEAPSVKLSIPRSRRGRNLPPAASRLVPNGLIYERLQQPTKERLRPHRCPRKRTGVGCPAWVKNGAGYGQMANEFLTGRSKPSASPRLTRNSSPFPLAIRSA